MGRHQVGKHWYKRYIQECPMCGRTDEWKLRVYECDAKRPEKYEDRVDHEMLLCYPCNAEFG